VRGINDDGAGVWSEVWNFTTIAAPPVIPGDVTLSEPADGTTDIGLSPEFSWSETADASSYQIQLANDSDFNSIVSDSAGITATSFQVANNLEYESGYYWRVRGVNDDAEGAWSDVWNFTTLADQNVVLPDVVTLANPADESMDIELIPEFSWNEANNSTSYQIQVAGNDEFNTIIVDSVGITGTTFTAVNGLNHETEYFWRVRAANDDGFGNWSEVWSFTTVEQEIILPGDITLSTPSNESTDVTVTPELSWSEATNTTSYHIQIATDSEFNNHQIDSSGLVHPAFSISEALDHGTQYYWRVRGANNDGEGAWSTTWSFTTVIAAPSAVSLLTPEDGAQIMIDSPEFIWSQAQAAESYTFQLSDDETFTTMMVDSSFAATDTSLSVYLDIESNIEYFWRVQAENAGGTSAWSDTFTFVVMDGLSTDDGELPGTFKLEQNYPNPFNPTTTISYGIPQASEVRLEVYNMLGQQVATLVDSRKSAGWHTVSFDAGSLSSGLYVYRISAAGFTQTRQMMLIK